MQSRFGARKQAMTLNSSEKCESTLQFCTVWLTRCTMSTINSSNLIGGLTTGQSISSPSWLPKVNVVPPGTQQVS
jgi:hypothetical protein